MLQCQAAAADLEFVGMPEARLPIAQAIIALCESPKSNSVCMAVDAALADAEKGGYGPVPVHLRDTHYAGHDRIGSGDGYKYPHDFPGHWVKQVQALSSLFKYLFFFFPTAKFRVCLIWKDWHIL